MTKADYVKLAEALRLGNSITDDYGVDDRTFPNAVADALADDNPLFDRERFLTACGVEP